MAAAAALVNIRPAFAEPDPQTVIEGPGTGAPTYTCDGIDQPGDIFSGTPAKGKGHCVALNGAPEKGPVHGVFFIHWRPDEKQPDNNDNIHDVRCVPTEADGRSGRASMPHSVSGTSCPASEVTEPWKHEPAHECDTAAGAGFPMTAAGTGNCRSINGAPDSGDTGHFIVISRDRSNDPNSDIECSAGTAQVPDRVDGTSCVYFH
ncbi:hypothetical protein [Actinomadura harenae]|uniref:Uncharacterized protein n=1 Tax=Actinomadura harenae TaxID=2483351 RepID=A0A3M2LLW5_9ACTN|nr:hypothetical protein [Actinomadura harenae]RMI38419.1 hypothetical protein EBO15_33040 [Actinomadura harenae]